MKINQVTEGSVRRDVTDFLSGLLSEQLKIPREQLNSAVRGAHTIPQVMVQSLRYHTEILKSHQGKGEDGLTSWEKGYIFDQGLSANRQKDTSLHLPKKCNYRRGRCVKSHIV